MKSIFSYLALPALALLSLVATSTASADIIVDFTAPGTANDRNDEDGFVFTSTDPSGTGVSFTLTASAAIPSAGGANQGDIARQNGGLGSLVENDGPFLNAVDGTSEILNFTVSDISGLADGESLVLTNLLSQGASGNYGGAFGQQGVDSVTFSSDIVGLSSQVDATANGESLGTDEGSALLVFDGSAGNTFSYSADDLSFNNTFAISLTGGVNNAIVVQGLEFGVASAVPEPSSLMLLGMIGTVALARRRR